MCPFTEKHIIYEEENMTKSTQKEELHAKRHNIAILLITLLIGVLFYALNYYTPLCDDDYSYSFSFSTGERIESIFQIFDSQIGHYQNTNGRSITHSLAQVFLLAGDNVFNFTNVIFFLVLLYLIYFHAFGSFINFSIAKLSVIAMLLFLSCPAFGQSFLWITGAANYLYGILIVLCVLLPYRRQVNEVVSNHSLWFEIIAATVYLLLGVIAGWTNENTSVAMIVMMIGYMVYFHIKSIKIHAWNITGCLGGVIGCFLMLSSPGTASRLDTAGGSGGIISWIKRMVFYSCDMFVNLQLAILIFVILSILFICQKRKQLIKLSRQEVNVLITECGVTFIYLIGFMTSVYSMIVSPQFPGRAWSGPIVIFLISMISLSSLVDMTDIQVKVGKNVAIGFLIILCASTYINAFFELKNINAAYYDRVATIESAVSSNEESVEIPNICGWSGYSCYSASGDLNSDSSTWPNTAIARYYGIDEIICSD